MIPTTPDLHSETYSTASDADSRRPSSGAPGESPVSAALSLAMDLAAEYQISALDEIGVAVLGRFKAGKSSFLNHFIGRDILPVGVVPVTAAG